MPNFVLEANLTMEKLYGVKICVFMALLCGAQLPVLATIDFGHQNWWNVVNFLLENLVKTPHFKKWFSIKKVSIIVTDGAW